jgi:lysophospholipase L1-like esterase
MPPPNSSISPRSAQRIRWFKRAIVLTTFAVSAALIAASAPARFQVRNAAEWVRDQVVRRVVGVGPDRARIDSEWTRRRAYSIDRTRDVLTKFYNRTSEPMRELFRVAGMDPAHGLIRYGRADEAFLISPQVFERDDHGRSYRMRPNTRSVWLRQITLNNGPFGLFLVPDTAEHRAAAARAGAVVDEGSIQNTNSWGLRGPEPDPNAPLRGIVLGDSFMQAMFNGDDETPSVYLARRLEAHWNLPVSIANTGHIGYSPEQYYFALQEYGERIRAQFVVVSVCPNDFGQGDSVFEGQGDWYDDAAYWLGRIAQWCRAHTAAFLLVAVPTHVQVESIRREGFYPGRISDIFRIAPAQYFNPVDDFIDEHLRLKGDAQRRMLPYAASTLYNFKINDNHFSPSGADLWARSVARRLILTLETRDPKLGVPAPRTTSTATPPRPNAPALH